MRFICMCIDLKIKSNVMQMLNQQQQLPSHPKSTEKKPIE